MFDGVFQITSGRNAKTSGRNGKSYGRTLKTDEEWIEYE
jgi:hypothetical protein